MRLVFLILLSFTLCASAGAGKPSPLWSSELAQELSYVQALPSIVAQVQAPVGRVSAKSLQVKLSSRYVEGAVSESDITELLHITALGKGARNKNSAFGYQFSGDFDSLPEGEHHFLFFAKHVSGQAATPSPFILKFIKDASAPVIDVSGVGSGYTNQAGVELVISVADFSPTQTKLFHNGELIKVSELKNFSVSLNLAVGANSFRIESVDQAQNVSSEEIAGPILDVTPPVISSTTASNQEVAEEFFAVNVSIADDSPVNSKLGHNEAAVFESSELNYTYQASLVEGENHFVISASDAAGNVAVDYMIANIVLKTSVAEIGAIGPGDSGIPAERIVVTELAEDPPELINNIYVPISPLIDVSDSANPNGVSFSGKYLTIEFSYDREQLLADGLNEVFQVLYRDSDGSYKPVAFTNSKVGWFPAYLLPTQATR